MVAMDVAGGCWRLVSTRSLLPLQRKLSNERFAWSNQPPSRIFQLSEAPLACSRRALAEMNFVQAAVCSEPFAYLFSSLTSPHHVHSRRQVNLPDSKAHYFEDLLQHLRRPIV